jgi:lauroyl/myristoyl acyltransferase
MKTYYLLRIATVLVRFVPPRVAYWLCSLIGGVIFSLNHNLRDAVLDNLRHVLPGSTLRQRRKVGRRAVRNSVKNYYDVVRLPLMTKDTLEHMVTVEGLEHFIQAWDAGKGFIVASGHLGNFSIVPQIAAARGYKVSIVAEDIEPQKLYDYVNKLRGSFGVHMIKLGSAEVRTIYKLIRNGEGLMLAIDRDVTDDGVLTHFFDGMAEMPPGPITLALRLNVPLILGYTYRRPDNTSIVYLQPPMEFTRTGDRDLDVKVNMRRLTRSLEGAILKSPDQWVVLQRVWNNEYTVDETIDEIIDHGTVASSTVFPTDGHSDNPLPLPDQTHDLEIKPQARPEELTPTT